MTNISYEKLCNDIWSQMGFYKYRYFVDPNIITLGKKLYDLAECCDRGYFIAHKEGYETFCGMRLTVDYTNPMAIKVGYTEKVNT